jgi:hypothetical protein
VLERQPPASNTQELYAIHSLNAVEIAFFSTAANGALQNTKMTENSKVNALLVDVTTQVLRFVVATGPDAQTFPALCKSVRIEGGAAGNRNSSMEELHH